MGAGPLCLLEHCGVEATEIEPESAWRAEIKTSFELYGALAQRVHEAVVAGDFPVVLAGNCGAAVGTAAGIGCDDLASIWFDAHADYNSPDRTVSGFLDGMGMSILTGRCWHALASSVPRFRPLPPPLAMHVGARDYSPGEREAMLADGVPLVEAASLDRATLIAHLDEMRRTASRVLIHVDLDVVDPKFGRANHYAVDGGLSPEQILQVIELAAERFTIAGLDLASYDPSQDPDGRIAEIAASIVRTTARVAESRRH